MGWQVWIRLLMLFILGLQACQPAFNRNYNRSGVDDSHLRHHLKSKNWRAADAETLSLLLQISGRTQAGWLRAADVAALSCPALLQVDQLWLEHSNGRFGFNRQRLIWLSLGGAVGAYSPQVAERFGNHVGWRSQGQWRSYNTLSFSAQAPLAHLPASTGNGVSGRVWGGVASISQRLQDCYRIAVMAARDAYYADCVEHQHQHHCRLKIAADRWGEMTIPDWGQEIPKLLVRLEQVLSRQEWIAADKITKTLLDHYRRANYAEFGDSDSHQLIPCYLLNAVDSLWMQYSQGRLGFGAQAAVMANLKPHAPHLPTTDSNDNASRLFRQAVGWSEYLPSRTNRNYNSAFERVAASRVPKGHYPYDMGESYTTYGSAYVGDWRFRLNPSCGFQ
jgi:GUN4-like